MKRREFIRNTASLIALPGISELLMAGNTASGRLLTALANAGETDRVLVLVQLKGGNDGLNTLIPLDQYAAYNNARKEVAIARSAVLALNGTETCGLHPAMTALQKRFNQGQLKIIQAVGYPSQNYSHFRSTDIWLSASDASELVTTGWAGRFLDTQYPGFPEGYPGPAMPDPLAIEVGSVLSAGFQGGEMNLSMSVSDPENFYSLLNGVQDPAPDTPAGKELDYIRTVAMQTNEYASVIINAANAVTLQSEAYPAQGTNVLADRLKIVARLIAGGLKTKIYLVSLSGFDTHNDQVDDTDSSQGVHAVLLKKVSEAIDAFMTDLEFLNIQNRVIGMTFSEFGRRIVANKSAGTDHGAAAPLFIFGNQVIPGILGVNPTIPASPTTNSNVAMQYDFRAVYASILNQWFKIEKNMVDAVLLKSFTTLPIIKSGDTSLPEPQTENVNSFRNLPNPFDVETEIFFTSSDEEIVLEVFDAKGVLVQTVVNQHYLTGNHSVVFNAGQLTPGMYYARLLKAGSVHTLAMIKK